MTVLKHESVLGPTKFLDVVTNRVKHSGNTTYQCIYKTQLAIFNRYQEQYMDCVLEFPVMVLRVLLRMALSFGVRAVGLT